MRTRFLQLLKFCVTGVANTAVYYLAYRLLLLALPYLAAHFLAWVVSVVFSFFVNCWFTFRVTPTWRRFVAFPSSSLANLAITTVGSVLLVSQGGVDERYATVIMGICAIPITFGLTAFVLRPSPAPDATAPQSAVLVPRGDDHAGKIGA